MKKSMILDTNKEYMVRNFITQNLWYGIELEKIIFDRIKYYDNMNNFIENDINYLQIKNTIKDYIISFENKEIFNSFIKRLKEINGSKTISNKKLLEIDGLNSIFKNTNELYSFIVNELIPVAKNI